MQEIKIGQRWGYLDKSIKIITFREFFTFKDDKSYVAKCNDYRYEPVVKINNRYYLLAKTLELQETPCIKCNNYCQQKCYE